MKNKYNIDDTLFLIENALHKKEVPCSTCEGEGKLHSKSGNPIICSRCHGTKKQNGAFYKWEITKDKFEVCIIKYENGTTNLYGEYEAEEDDLVEEDDLFLTIEEARAERDKRNGEG